MSTVGLFIIPIVIYLIFAAMGTFVLSRVLRNTSGLSNVLCFALPICAWLLLAFSNDKGKTLSNLIVEPFVLAIVVCLLGAVQSVVAARGILAQKPLEILSILSCIVAAVCVFVLMPSLPE